MTQVHF